MSKVTLTRPLIALTKNMTSYVLTALLAFVVGCAEVSPKNMDNSPWVPATAETEQSLGVSNWYVETLEGGTTRIVGYDQLDTQLSEMRISSPVLNEVQTLTYELYVTQHTRVVMTESGVIENTLSVEPKGTEWFDAMVNVQARAKKNSPVNKSFLGCVGLNAGLELGSIACDIGGGGYGHPADYFSVCMAIYNCLASGQDQNQNYHNTQYASNNTGSSGYGYNDTWSSSSNTGSTCYDSWGYPTPCQNNYQSNYQSNQNSGCYDAWGYPVSCGQTW